jgi:uncharacterized protein
MEKTSYDPGTPSWVDVGVSDVEQAARFYGALFGWQVDPGPEEAGGYRMAMLKGHPVAGLGPATDPGPPFWSTYLSVADADATRDEVVKAGGTVLVEPTETMDFGRFAVYTDPVGAQFSTWQPMRHTGSGLVNEPGAMAWHELHTARIEPAVAFYRQVFGWGRDDTAMPDDYVVFTLPAGMIAGLMPVEGDASRWVVYFLVEETDAAAARVTELGGSVLEGPADSPGGRYALVADPEGARFAVVQPMGG